MVWRSDGGRGLWRLLEECWAASATGLLDFDHAVQHLGKGAAAWWDGRTLQARRGLVWTQHRLRQGHPDGVLADLADALEVDQVPTTARETLRTVSASLERHREHIN